MPDPITLTDELAGTVTLGDLEVRRLGYGAMRITGEGIWGPPEDPDGTVELLRQVVAAGVTLIDTADSYGPEVSEELIAEALHPYPADLVIATKGGLTRSGPGEWSPDCRPEHLHEACEASLRRLRTDVIDVYQLHTVDPQVPFAESVGALKELREEGKIRHAALCNVGPEQLAQAREIVDVVSVQNRYNLAERRSDTVVDACEEAGIAFLPWYPLGAASLVDDERLQGVAERREATPAQVALAWLLHRSPVIAPIPGTSSPAHLAENLAAAVVHLTAGDMDELDELAR